MVEAHGEPLQVQQQAEAQEEGLFYICVVVVVIELPLLQCTLGRLRLNDAYV